METLTNLAVFMALLTTSLVFPKDGLSQVTNQVTDKVEVITATPDDKVYSQAMLSSQNFIESINEARRELSIREVDLARQKIIMARNLLVLIARAPPTHRRLTRVEFGGGEYSDDLGNRKNYSPIETKSLEDFTITSGPRWVKNTRSESTAEIVYITLDLTNNTQDYLDRAEKLIDAGNIKGAQVQLEELSDVTVKIDEAVPLVIQARDYIRLAENYIEVGNFFGGRNSMEKANSFLLMMTSSEVYKAHYKDIVILHKGIDELQASFATLDAKEMEAAKDNLKKWKSQLESWVDK